LRMLEGYRHSLLIIKYKHQRYQRSLLMASYNDMYTRNKRGIEMKMETTIGLWQGEWNHFQVLALCRIVFCVLNGNCCYMCCCRWSTLHQIYMSRIGNDNVHPSPKIISSDDNIHSFLCMVGEKVGSLFLYVNSTLQCDSCKIILKCIMGCNAFTLAWAM
jgi:hypothetical protein